MKSFKGYTQGIQGDIAFTRIDSLPDGVVLARTKRGKYVVARSGSGHNHVIDEPQAKMYNHSTDPMLSFLVVDSTAYLKHLREFDTHETVQFDKGIYQVNRQREYTPHGLRHVAD